MTRFITTVLLASLSGAAIAEEQGSLFPIWGDEARARGYTIPKPYGLSLSYMDLSNPVEVNSISLTGTDLLEAVSVDAPNANFDGYNVTVRGDLWVFPFWNLYGIIGYTDGDSVATIESLGCDASKVSGVGDKLLCAAIDAVGPAVQGAPFALELNGGSYGIGTTLAGGIGNWFALVDMNYTYTSLSALDGEIGTFTGAPRVGYRWELARGSEMRAFIGGMYMAMDQELSGNISDLLPEVAAIAGDGKFKVSQKGTSRWNGVVGAMYSWRGEWELLGEIGFGDRETYFASVSRRF
ncbi:MULTISPECIES: hypothetical protein [Ferrimonas]|uniref:hypothetical protein n=1 Tax=Ferrimonas TaxID=44011 RepID=UPI0004283AB7|nr:MULTISPECIES: hypothetical protein [Ferrimonas]USD39390.1 hypothetical protein J8Z22_09990 [Ferrimonas sp. SCSIO 43195]